jgi:hypothetical protein
MPIDALILHLKTAHIYEPEFEYKSRLIKENVEKAWTSSPGKPGRTSR